ncbi:MAG: DUF4136 domain-containing protein [Bacteroidales bacterium]|nr:DUF4136 domain-containing protein [Bacteroidales bacterium]
MKIVKSFLLLVIVAAMASCSSVKVVVDVDKTVDFTQYTTYNFLGWQADSDKLMNEMDRNRVHAAFKNEFDARGMKYVEENGDMAVSLFFVIDQKTSTTAYTNYYGGRYGGYNRYGGGWGMGYANTTYSEHDYLVGTLVMDAFDGKSKDQIWQGVAKSTITENPAKREKATPKKIAYLMNKFPVPKK